MVQIFDTTLTDAAASLLVGSAVYFAISFAAFVWRAESDKANNAKTAASTAPVQGVNPEAQQTEADREQMATAMPTMQPEQADLESETRELETAVVETVQAVEPLRSRSTARIAYRSAASPSLMQAAIVIPNLETVIKADGESHAIKLAQTDERCQATPRIERRSLKIWKRRGESVVPVHCLSVPIPAHVQRLQWRGAEVIRLDDLSAIVEIV